MTIRLVALIEGEEQEVSLEPLDGDLFRLRCGDVDKQLSVQSLGQRRYLVLDGMDVHDVSISGGSPDLIVHARGLDIPVTLLSERELLRRGAGAGLNADGSAVIQSPMPGKVVKAMVAAGDQVDEGQAVIVVEAMKMENELKSPIAGTVAEFFAADGESVDAGQKLVVIEAANAP